MESMLLSSKPLVTDAEEGDLHVSRGWEGNHDDDGVVVEGHDAVGDDNNLLL